MLQPRLTWGVCVLLFHNFSTLHFKLHHPFYTFTCTLIPLYPVVGRHALVAVLARAAIVTVAPGHDAAHEEEEAANDTKHGSHGRAVAHM